MCLSQILSELESCLQREDIEGKRILEIGARNVNGSVRGLFLRARPAEYVGIDIEPGEGVDVVCDVDEAAERFGRGAFDFVISTDVLEHVRDWKSFVTGAKRLLREDGCLFLSTCALGFPFHAYPFDFWRFEEADLRAAFSDFDVEQVVRHDEVNAISIFARRRSDCTEADLSGLETYSMLRRGRCRGVTELEVRAHLALWWVFQRVRHLIPLEVRHRLRSTIFPAR